jgi:uncharacterized membrane protein YesL
MQVDPDSRINHGVSMLVQFIGLNVLFLVTCLPVVTIGAAVSSLLEVTMRYADDERGYPIRDYVGALRKNFLQATLVFVPLALALVLLTFGAAFWWQTHSTVGPAAGIVAMVASVYVLAALIYALGLVAAYRNTARETLKNAFLLAVAEPLRTLGLILIPVVGVAVMIVVHAFVFLVLTIGFSFGAYLSALLLRGVFARHAQAPAEDRDPMRDH